MNELNTVMKALAELTLCIIFNERESEIHCKNEYTANRMAEFMHSICYGGLLSYVDDDGWPVDEHTFKDGWWVVHED